MNPNPRGDHFVLRSAGLSLIYSYITVALVEVIGWVQLHDRACPITHRATDRGWWVTNVGVDSSTGSLRVFP